MALFCVYFKELNCYVDCIVKKLRMALISFG